MATDVRSLLRAERASRRITHPHATYTPEGKLLCNLCGVFVKSEALWQAHLHSGVHVQKSSQPKGKGKEGGGVKRKAEGSPTAEGEEEVRKRVRGDEDGDVVAEEEGKGGEGVGDVAKEEIVEGETDTSIRRPPPIEEAEPLAQRRQEETPTIDEAEFLAFERDIALLEQQQAESQAQAQSALTTAPTISAAPLTAEQLAAQASDERSAQRGKREREMEEEDREDAARGFEVEEEEMRGLEERVRRLRERREEVRRGVVEETAGAVEDSGGLVGGEGVVGAGEDDDDDDDDDDEDDYEDDWGFGAS